VQCVDMLCFFFSRLNSLTTPKVNHPVQSRSSSTADGGESEKASGGESTAGSGSGSEAVCGGQVGGSGAGCGDIWRERL